MSEIDRLAAILADTVGTGWSRAFEDKREWIDHRGMRGHLFVDVNEPYKNDWREGVQAIVNALREPDDDVWKAGSNAIKAEFDQQMERSSGRPAFCVEGFAIEGWQAMIDAILADA